MARRKRVLDDSDSDSSPGRSDDDFGNDPDLRDERELFQDSYNANAGERTTRTMLSMVYSETTRIVPNVVLPLSISSRASRRRG